MSNERSSSSFSVGTNMFGGSGQNPVNFYFHGLEQVNIHVYHSGPPPHFYNMDATQNPPNVHRRDSDTRPDFATASALLLWQSNARAQGPADLLGMGDHQPRALPSSSYQAVSPLMVASGFQEGPHPVTGQSSSVGKGTNSPVPVVAPRAARGNRRGRGQSRIPVQKSKSDGNAGVSPPVTRSKSRVHSN